MSEKLSYYERHKEKMRAASRNWAAANRAKSRANSARWRAEHPNYNREWTAQNHAARLDYWRRREAANPARIRMAALRARRRAAGATPPT